jgi:hypothetical protein
LIFEEMYLGLPSPDGRMSRGKLQNLQAQLTKRLLCGAMATWLKLEGRSLLNPYLKPCLSISWVFLYSLSRYVMILTRLVRNFYWGEKDGKRKTNCRAWEKLQRPKKQGRLGFRDFRVLNQASLARQAWRFC